METIEVIDRWFHILNESATLISENKDMTYLEAIGITAENIISESVLQPDLEEQLTPLYDELYQINTTPEQVRKAIQLVVLKGMKDSAQPQHQMTPDAVALFIGYLVNKLPLGEGWTCLDLAVGTGNLLTAVLNQSEKNVGTVIGVDVDELLIKLAQATINLQQHVVELHHQDSLRPLLVDPVDLVISDLPYGYYFDQEHARGFQLGQVEHPFSHTLMIEQALIYAKPEGFLMFIIPNDLFSSDNDKALRTLIHDQAIILGLLQLPPSLFRETNQAKSILLLQKKGQDTVPPKQALLVELPSFKNREAMESIMFQINQWFKDAFQK